MPNGNFHWSDLINPIGMASNIFVTGKNLLTTGYNRINDFAKTGMTAQQRLDAKNIADERVYSQDQINSARAWEEYMDSTAVQRRVKDIEAAGLNPWLALGSISPGNVSVSDTGSSAGSVNRSSSQSKSNSAVSAAMIMALGKLALKLL